MNFGGRKVKVLYFFKDAVPDEDEIEDVASINTGFIQLMTRNAAAVGIGERPETADFVMGAITPPYKDYRVFDAAAAKELAAEAKKQRQAATARIVGTVASLPEPEPAPVKITPPAGWTKNK